jgi:hypothetical protein
MNAMTKIGAAVVTACIALSGSMSASAWWDDDDYYDRWHRGPWYGRYPGYGWHGHPGYGWGAYPGYGWGGYPGSRQPKTIIVNPQINVTPSEPETKLPE